MTQIDTSDGILTADYPVTVPAHPWEPAIGPAQAPAPLGVPRLAKTAYRRAFIEALRHRQFGIAGALVNTWHGCSGYFRFAAGAGTAEHKTVAPLEFRGGHCIISVSRHLNGRRLEFVSARLLTMLSLLATCRDAPAGRIALNLDDYGLLPGLAFSAAGSDSVLIPDPVYLMEDAYRRTAAHYANHDVAWSDRRKIAFWRGTTTGGEIDCAHWEMLDRVRLCRIGAEHPALFDTGLVGVVQMNEDDSAAIKASGLVRDFVPETDFIKYRYQIDIDGNTNSWPGLFQKLLTGSPVLKVASRHGFRQWYYDRLIPWKNYVPVASDMSDLIDKLNWLATHDEEARRIGAAGRNLALSMTMGTELRNARTAIYAALTAGAQ
jgi:hypothetical protein